MADQPSRGAGAGYGLARRLPLANALQGYTRARFLDDLIAGIITAILLVPQGMAFALLAGLPPQVGLYASILPPIVYALLGTSRTLSVGPVSVAAIMVAAALHDLPPGTDLLSAALMLALLSGAILLAMGVLRLGVVANLLSHPVLSGFTTAAALIIIISQLPALTGITPPAIDVIAGFPGALMDTIIATPAATALIGLCSVLFLLLAGGPMERALLAIGMRGARAVFFSRVAPLAVLLLSTLAVRIGSLHEVSAVAVVGVIPGGLPVPGFANLPWSTALSLLPAALLIGLVSYVESLSIAKTLANRRRQRLDADQELIALGSANIAAAAVGGMPVAGGFSRTMVNFAAGAQTQVASIITALLVALVAAFLSPLLADVRKAALAAIIIVAVAKLVDLRGARSVWRYDRIDGIVLAITAVGVLAAGIEAGLAIGIIASVGSLVLRMSRPHVAVMGRIAGSEHFRNIRRHQVETWPHLLFLRVDESLTFPNAARVEAVIMAEITAQPALRNIVLVMSSVNAVDSTAIETLERLAEALRHSGVTLHLSDVKGPVMDHLNASHLLAAMKPGQVFLSANLAAQTLAHPRD